MRIAIHRPHWTDISNEVQAFLEYLNPDKGLSTFWKEDLEEVLELYAESWQASDPELAEVRRWIDELPWRDKDDPYVDIVIDFDQ